MESKPQKRGIFQTMDENRFALRYYSMKENCIVTNSGRFIEEIQLKGYNGST
jgi:hypothetical protein